MATDTMQTIDTDLFDQTDDENVPAKRSVETGIAGRGRYEPKNLGELMRYCNVIVQSNLCPDHIQTPADALLIIQQGAELGLNAMTALQNLHVVNGRVGMEAKMAVALIRKSPLCEYIQPVSYDREHATWETKRTDEDTPNSFTFDKTDKAKAKLSSNTWAKYPKQMYLWRAAMNLARIKYSEVILGLYSVDELAELSSDKLQHTAEQAKSPTEETSTSVEALPSESGPPSGGTEVQEYEAGDTTNDEVESSDDDTGVSPANRADDYSHYDKWKSARRSLGKLLGYTELGDEHLDLKEQVIASAFSVESIARVSPAELEAIVETLGDKSHKPGDDGAMSERAALYLDWVDQAGLMPDVDESEADEFGQGDIIV
ncbi:MAG: hypothetical protein U5L04_02515 [Trueperaceae bacterium]|nr:hypothetical protein [Trueperaceae bacterium]